MNIVLIRGGNLNEFGIRYKKEVFVFEVPIDIVKFSSVFIDEAGGKEAMNYFIEKLKDKGIPFHGKRTYVGNLGQR